MISGGARPETSSPTPILSYRQTGANRLVVDLPKLVASKLLLQAASGGGKSWAVRQLAEELFGKVPIIIIDPEGEFHTLREKYDFVLAAVRGGDVEASLKTAPILARRLIEARGSAVLDLSEMKPGEQRQFVRRFLETLIGLPRDLWHPTIVIVDEAHIFGPESGHGEAESLDAMSDFGTRARKRGFCFVCATTRIAKLHKDIVANLHNKLIGFNSLDVDIDRAAKELGFTKDGKATIRQLDPGTFYAYGPAISKEVTLVRTGPVETTHPKPGMTVAVAAVPPSSKVKALIASSLADLPKEAEEEARTIDELRRANADLSKKLRVAEKAMPAPTIDGKAIERAVEAERKAWEKSLRPFYDENRRRMRSVRESLVDYQTRLSGIAGRLAHDIEQLDSAIVRAAESGAGVRETSRASTSGVNLKEREERGVELASRVAPAAPVRRSADADELPLSKGEQRILDAMAEMAALGIRQASRVQVGMMAGLTLTAGAGSRYVAGLMAKDLVRSPQPGQLVLTDAGTEQAAVVSLPADNEGVQRRVLDRLGDSEQKILAALIDLWPDAVERTVLGPAVGLTLTAGAGSRYVAKLVTMGAATLPKPGSVRAADVLFPENR